MNTITKMQIAEFVSAHADIPQSASANAVRSVLDGVVDALTQGDKVELRGFGSFRIRERAARVGRNPKTGDSVAVPAKRIPYFKPGKDLRIALLQPDD